MMTHDSSSKRYDEVFMNLQIKDNYSSYGKVYLNIEEQEMSPMSKYEVDEHILGIRMAQKYILNKGINEFGEKGEKEVKK